MVWAILVAAGVAVVSMTLFGARITKRPQQDLIVESIESDPNDPWAAWKPRDFEEMDRPRPRIWPILSAFTGLALVGAGFAGARQTLWATEAAQPTLGAIPSPYTVQVDIPATPTLKPTPKPTPTVAPATQRPTAAPSTPTATTAPAASTTAATAAPTGSGPTISGSATCASGKISVSYSATAHGSPLSWVAVWVDGASVKGGPISGETHSSSYSGAASAGDHDVEVTVEDKAGRSARKTFVAHCS